METAMPIERGDAPKMFLPTVAEQLGVTTRTMFRYLDAGILREPADVIVHPETNSKLRLWTQAEVEQAKELLREKYQARMNARRDCITFNGIGAIISRAYAAAIMSGTTQQLYPVPELCTLLGIEKWRLREFCSGKAVSRWGYKLQPSSRDGATLLFTLADVHTWAQAVNRFLDQKYSASPQKPPKK